MEEEAREQMTRQEARAQKKRKKRAKIKQHSKGLARIYEDAVRKRTGKKGK